MIKNNMQFRCMECGRVTTPFDDKPGFSDGNCGECAFVKEKEAGGGIGAFLFPDSEYSRHVIAEITRYLRAGVEWIGDWPRKFDSFGEQGAYLQLSRKAQEIFESEPRGEGSKR